MQNLTDNDAFTSPVQGIEDGDRANAVNTNPGLQALADRTRYLNNRRNEQDDLNADNYTVLNQLRSRIIDLANTNSHAAALNLDNSANDTMLPGDYVYLQFDTGFETMASAILDSDHFGLTFSGSYLGTFEVTVDIDVTGYGDGSTNYALEFDLTVNGTVVRKFVGRIHESGASNALRTKVTGTAIVKIANADQMRLVYAAGNGGNAGRITGLSSSMTIKQLSDLTNYAGITSPTNPA